jgi:predicted peptidase
MAQLVKSFETQASVNYQLNYLLHLPAGYDGEAQREWPVILFLHGMGERGNNLEMVRKQGLARLVERQPGFPFIVVSPQCPAESWWSEHLYPLGALLDEISEQYRVDPARIYLTGLSMGGYGTWHLLSEHPQRFAAAIPICGGMIWYLNLEKRAERIKDVPIWVFHGDADTVVPLSASQQVVDALKAAGSLVRFTVYPGVEHDSWTQTYENPAIYDWLLEHTTDR